MCSRKWPCAPLMMVNSQTGGVRQKRSPADVFLSFEETMSRRLFACLVENLAEAVAND
jgi:hypothetical protein